MMQGWKRLVAMMAALTLVLSMCPVQWLQTAARAESATGTVTADGVFLRKQPSKTADYWFKLDTGFECEVQDVVTSGGITWYKVKSAHPTSSTTNTYIGYIHSDYFVLNSTGGTEDSTVDDEIPEGAGGASEPDGDTGSTGDTGSAGDTGSTGSSDSTGGAESTYLVGEVNADQVNFRKTAGGELIDKLNKGDRVEILSVPAAITANDWYKVRYNGKEGYIQAPFLTVVGTSVTAPDDFGFVKLILSSANLRSAPAGTVLAQWTTKGEVLPVTGPSQKKDGYSWYPVLYKGAYYFVREDCVQQVASADGGSTSTDGTTVTAKGYLKTTKAGVNLRLQPGGDVIQQVEKGVVVTRLSDLVSSSGYSWYLVQVDSVRGYMRSDCVTFVNSDGSATTPPAATVTTPPAVTDGAYGYVITTAKGVNLRAKPAGTSQEQIDKGVILPMTGYAVVSGKYTWYPVRAASGRTGYVRGDCATPCTSDGTATTAPTAPSDGTVVTPPPAATTYGYVMIKSNSVNVRKTAGGSVLGKVDKGTVWPMTGASTTKGGYTWYPIKADSLTGYVRGDHSFKLSPTQEASYLAGNGVPDESGSSSGVAVTQYVQTILDKVNLRASASKDANAPYNVPLGTVMAYNSSRSVGGSLWYRVIYDNTEVWVLGTCVKVMTQAEYEAYLATKPAATPQPSVVKGYIKTTADGVNLRATAGGAKILGRLDKGVVLAYSESVTTRNYTWYCVQTSLGTGYLRGDCVEICDSNGNTVVTPTTPGGSTGTGQEATYTTLRKGSTGTAVTNLVTELKLQGYYTGEITSSYTSAVEDAVKKFQKANGLTVDGIAGSQTQHKLYGTVPVGEGDSSNLTMTIYPAEKIDWYTGGIQTLWAKGSSYKVYDVKTGIVWWARRWSGANHADVEPLTAADTARLCKIYGVSTAKEIETKNLWQRRPCLVTIGSRTFACSLYGIPHNYPEGDTIPNNNMDGQVCIHFSNSKTHLSDKVDTDHQAAIEYAWKNAPNGYK